jgi:hypothetical protein
LRKVQKVVVFYLFQAIRCTRFLNTEVHRKDEK